MHLDRLTGARSHHAFHELPDLLRAGDLLVVNTTRVRPARLLGRRATSGAAEVLLLRSHSQAESDAYLKPGGKLRPGDRIRISDELQVEVVAAESRPDGARRVRLHTSGDVDAALARHGHVPLPPYIRRADTPSDRDRYQTVYAREGSSVAAPTAGLHFTHELLENLAHRGVSLAQVRLDVGPGTFKPVAVDEIEEHRADPEPYDVPEATAVAIARTRAAGGRIVVVGTTTLRTLETAACADGVINPGPGESSLVVLPGYRFKVVDALLTNFHLPRSSLLLLVAALTGRERLLEAYAAAVQARYRFYSYGDAMLIT